MIIKAKPPKRNNQKVGLLNNIIPIFRSTKILSWASFKALIEHNSFSESQFLLDGMKKPYRFHVGCRKGGLLVYANKDIPSKYLRSFHLPQVRQVIPIEVNLNKRELLVVSKYRPPRSEVRIFFVIYNRFTWPLP